MDRKYKLGKTKIFVVKQKIKKERIKLKKTREKIKSNKLILIYRMYNYYTIC